MNEMTNEQYHADVSRISKSGLDLIQRSPAHYYAAYIDPKREFREPTAAMKIGSAIHCAVLEPLEFDKRYLIAPKIDRRSAAGKQAYSELLEKAESERLIFIDTEDRDKCLRIRDAVFAHPVAETLLQSGKAEHTVKWTDPTTGAQCKSRIDFDSDTGFITDLKSTEDASESEFGKSSFSYRYHVQARFYYDGKLYSTGRPPRGFAFIAVEKTPPYAVAVYYADEKVLQLGLEHYMPNLQTYVECLRNNEWPAYTHEIKPLSLPAWAFRKL